MRVLGEIPHDKCRIQVFQYGTRFSLKLETPHYEQTFKLRESEYIENFRDVAAFCDEAFIDDVVRNFLPMHEAAVAAFQRLRDTKD